MDSFTDDSAVPSCSSGVAVRKRKSVVDKSAADANVSIKSKEREIAMAGIQCAMKQLEKCKTPSSVNDDFHTFGMFIASELRSLKDLAYAKASQRKLNKVLLDIMEDEPVITNDKYIHLIRFIVIDDSFASQIVKPLEYYVDSQGQLSLIDPNAVNTGPDGNKSTQ